MKTIKIVGIIFFLLLLTYGAAKNSANIILLILSLFCGVIGKNVAVKNDYDKLNFFMWGLFLNVIGLFIISRIIKKKDEDGKRTLKDYIIGTLNILIYMVTLSPIIILLRVIDTVKTTSNTARAMQLLFIVLWLYISHKIYKKIKLKYKLLETAKGE
ncbi:MAG: hypothetical protein ACOC1K_07550 [Nanoarchaeota archaeon]